MLGQNKKTKRRIVEVFKQEYDDVGIPPRRILDCADLVMTQLYKRFGDMMMMGSRKFP